MVHDLDTGDFLLFLPLLVPLVLGIRMKMAVYIDGLKVKGTKAPIWPSTNPNPCDRLTSHLSISSVVTPQQHIWQNKIIARVLGFHRSRWSGNGHETGCKCLLIFQSAMWMLGLWSSDFRICVSVWEWGTWGNGLWRGLVVLMCLAILELLVKWVCKLLLHNIDMSAGQLHRSHTKVGLLCCRYCIQLTSLVQ